MDVDEVKMDEMDVVNMVKVEAIGGIRVGILN